MKKIDVDKMIEEINIDVENRDFENAHYKEDALFKLLINKYYPKKEKLKKIKKFNHWYA